MYGVPPYGYNYLSPRAALRHAVHYRGQRRQQRSAVSACPPPLDASAGHPYPSLDFSNYLPVNADPFFATTTGRRIRTTSWCRPTRARAQHGGGRQLYRQPGRHILVIRQATQAIPPSA